MKKMKTMDGNTAAAHISYAFTEVAAIYPITPSSPMAEHVDEWAAKGRKNIFGQPVKIVEMQSEGGASGAVHGALQGGALTTTYTASQGLLLMIPNMYKIAGELLPGVFHVAARAIAASSLSIFGDHQDVMATRQTGFAILAEGAVQEVMDLSAVAHLSAIKSRIPFINFFDGFRTSHEIQKIEVLDQEDLKPLIDMEALRGFRQRALSPNHPVTRGTAQNPDIYFQEREAVNKFYDAVPDIVEGYMAEITKLTGREYHCFDYYGAKDADRIIIAMGSCTDLCEETVDYLNAKGQKVGVVKVRLYRPFDVERLKKAIPATVKKIAVLDKTKEPGSNGEPLYLDIVNAFNGDKNAPVIIGGRYGLGSKDPNPSHIVAVYDNLAKDEPKKGFTIGIVDDVTNTSLEIDKDIDATKEGTVACKFWGLGSDGTVGANKSAIKIIGDHTEMYAQGYFSYDSKKSGGVTVSHLRFGKTPIKSPYLIDKADFVACHNQAYVHKYNVLDGLKKNGTFLLNTIWTPEEVNKHLPASYKRYIAKNNIKFYTLNAVKIAQEIGLGGRINMIMQSAFFKLANIIPLDDAVKYLKDAVVTSYGKKGQKVVDMNNAAIDKGIESLVEIKVPAEWKDAKDEAKPELKGATEFVKRIVEPMNRLEGFDLPVSAFDGMEDGTFEQGTAAFEKRGIAINVPEWDKDKCIQCNQCSFVCPHAAIRPFLLNEKEKENAPEGFKSVAAKGLKTAETMNFTIQVDPIDCTGCGNCAQVCPAPGKALVMKPAHTQAKEMENFEYATTEVSVKDNPMSKTTVKGSQFEKPLLEFSGACGGCGETPYVKLITQLFGDRMMISNATGCSSIWGGSAPSTPYTTNHKGFGPSWANSLFEDNAEYGLGMFLGAKAIRERLVQKANDLILAIEEGEAKEALKDFVEHVEDGAGTRDRADRVIKALEKLDNNIAKEILEEKDFLIKPSQWIFGGDGWSYDIGYGGVDHVLASGEDVNIFVFDTEVYSNTGGQASKATPTAAVAKFTASGKKTKKKDLGMMAMSYGYVYVAQVSMGADKNQVLKAIAEAENYDGPSLIIGYAPCINHGIKLGMGNSQLEAKRAVDCGYWSMYRYNPELKGTGKNPFTLDSKEPNGDFREFLMGEVRYASLAKSFPEFAEALFEKTYNDAMERIENYKKLASK